MEFKISVVMAVYNGEEFVERQIKSILAQTRVPDEIVVCDDCSTDRAVALVRRFTADRGVDVRVLRNDRKLGANRSFERAISEATGDIIFLAAADDYWFPERVSAVIAPFVESSGVVMVYCDAELADSELKPTGATLFGRRSRLRFGNTSAPDAIFARAGLVQGPTIAFRRELKPFLLPLSREVAEDRWISMIAHAVGAVRLVDRPLLYYRRHDHNTAGHGDLEKGAPRRRVGEANSEYYAFRTRRLKAVERRLREIKASDLPLPSGSRLDEILDASARCLAFARRRERMKHRSRIARVPSALLSLAHGDYNRDAGGVKSFLLDVAVR